MTPRKTPPADPDVTPFTYGNLRELPLAGQYRHLAWRLERDRPKDDVQAHAVAGMLRTMADFEPGEKYGSPR